MAEPAREDAPHPGSEQPGIRETVLRLIASAVEGGAAALAELAAHPECTAALRRAEVLAAVHRDLADLVRGLMLDETVLARAEARAYAQGAADARAARCSLSVLPGG